MARPASGLNIGTTSIGPEDRHTTSMGPGLASRLLEIAIIKAFRTSANVKEFSTTCLPQAFTRQAQHIYVRVP
jgi:hypothetical protein